jgi:hypothetical protein
MRTPLLVDTSAGLPTSGLSIVQYGAETVKPKGCLVVGSKDRVRLSPDEVKTRVVAREEDERLQALVPRHLLSAKRGAELRVEAGHKTEACDEYGNPSVSPWIGAWPAYPSLVAAVPGKATLALCVAEQIMDSFAPQMDALNDAPDAPPPAVPPPGEDSDYIPKMHHDPFFDDLLDEVEK